jgi:endonuclease/exonuclease/phosphatase family metal-dependent hydrolase
MIKIYAQSMLLAYLLVGYVGCESKAVLTNSTPPISSPKESGSLKKVTLTLSVMAYNVENLFDTVKDPNTDFTFLPLEQKKQDPEVQSYCARQKGFYQNLCYNLDWSESTLDIKLNRIKNTIESATTDFTGPDIVILEEVENMRVLEMLQNKLQSSNYQYFLLQGSDRRGINIGVLTKLPLAKDPQLHTIPFERSEDGKVFQSRGIFEVAVKLPNQQTLHIFGVHFPSQSNPHSYRRQAALELNRLMKSRPHGYVLAGGDFNTIKAEAQNIPRLYEDVLGREWLVSHIDSCKNCLGTHFFQQRDPVNGELKGGWDFLDALLFPKSWLEPSSEIRLKKTSIQVVTAGRYQSVLDPRSRQRIPARFEPREPVGVSDHFPIYAEFELDLRSQTDK